MIPYIKYIENKRNWYKNIHQQKNQKEKKRNIHTTWHAFNNQQYDIQIIKQKEQQS